MSPDPSTSSGSPAPILESLDLKDPGAVAAALLAGAQANRAAPCREGSIDRIAGPGRLVATGDLHDNPLHLARLVEAAGMVHAGAAPAAHITFHEIIHGDRLVNGMDFSYRALARIAALKAAFPAHVHALLANHELAQIIGSGIVKDGVRVVEAFSDAVEYAFGGRAGEVNDAIADFIRSMPLALRCDGAAGSTLCAHSLPAPELMDRFDPSVLSRDLTEEDYTPRRGAAHLMIWGRCHTAEQLRALGETWDIAAFILGHEKADTGITLLEPNTIVLNSDHDRGVYLEVDLDHPPTITDAAARIRPLGSGAA